MTAQGFLTDRRDYFDLLLVKTGEGWSIALRIDGTYFDKAVAKRVAEGWREVLPDLIADVPRDGWDKWR